MLKNTFLLTYLYICILSIIAIWYHSFYWKVFSDWKIVSVLLFCLVPFFDFLYTLIYKENKDSQQTPTIHLYQWIGLATFSLLNFFILESVSVALLFIFMFSYIIFRFDTRYIFLWALTYLLITICFITFWNKEFSELFSIHAYYLLIFWVISEIYNSTIWNNKIEWKAVDTEKNSNLVKNHIDSIIRKIETYKESILSDIWELPDKKSERKDTNDINNSVTQSGSFNNQWGLYTKLFHYFLNKIDNNIKKITLISFIVASFALVLNLYFNIKYLVFFVVIITLTSYLYSKINGTNYKWSKYPSDFSIPSYENQFLVIFASLWVLWGYVLHKYFLITGNISSWEYIGFFLLFASWFYMLNSWFIFTICKNMMSFSKKDKTFSFSEFAKKYTYIILWFFVIWNLLGLIWVKSWMLDSYKKWAQEKKGYEQFVIIEDTLWENFSSDNFSEKIDSQDKTTPQKLEMESKKIWEIYTFSKQLQVWSVSDQVGWLKDILKRLGYFKWEVDEVFDEATKQALTQVLIKECGWPETTLWVLWAQAQECLYSLNMEVPIDLKNKNDSEKSVNTTQKGLENSDSFVNGSSEENLGVSDLSDNNTVIKATDDSIENTLWSQDDQKTQNMESQNIWEIYSFSKTLQIWSVSDQVRWLEDILKRLGYFEWEIDQIFDNNTKQGLKQVLIQKCGWPDTTLWVLWAQAQECLYSLNMNVPVDTRKNSINDSKR